MRRLTFNKAALHQQIRLLKRYRQFLPSLDLKRKQLLQERAKAQARLSDTQKQLELCLDWVETELPMLADSRIEVESLVKIRRIKTTEKNSVGIRLPVLETVEFEPVQYSYFCKPHWVDGFIHKMQQALRLNIQLSIERQRLDILQHALRKVTQRVNLFDKVLIPQTLDNIRKIRIYLSDNERAAVIRSKITKQKRAG